MIDPKDVVIAVDGHDFPTLQLESRYVDPTPTVTLPIVLDSDADKSLCEALKAGKVKGQPFRAGPVSFTVSRVRRQVDSLRPGEALWSFWS